MLLQRTTLIGAAAALALLVGCGVGKKPVTEAASGAQIQARERARVRTVPAETREMVRRLSTTTTVESEREIQLYPRMAGVVVELRVDEGERVATGDVLAVLDARGAQAALRDAEVALQEARDAVPRLTLAVREAAERAERAKLGWEQAKREVDRNEKAALLSEVELDKLRLARDTSERDYQAALLAHESAQRTLDNQATTIERAKVAVEREEIELSYTRISAPFDAIVAARSIRVGDTVSSGAAAFTLTDPDHLRAIVYRPQRELAFFQAARRPDGVGSDIEIQVHPEALPGEVYEGSIRFLSPTIDPESGTFRLTVDLAQPGPDDPRPRLLPGMLVRLEITTDRHPQALVVPKRALRREGEAHTLVAVREGRAVVVEVEEGFSDDERVEVLPVEGHALAVGEPVVVVGNRDLENGAPVDVGAWEEPGAGAPFAARVEPAAGTEAGTEAGAETATAPAAEAGQEAQPAAKEDDGAAAEDGESTAADDGQARAGGV